MLSREDFGNRILHLVPDAKFSFWPAGSRDFSRIEKQQKTRKVIDIIDEEAVERDEIYFEDVQVSGTANMGNEAPLINMGGYTVDWRISNLLPCPSYAEIEALNKKVVDDALAVKVKEARNKEKLNDLAIVACYEIEKKSNPALAFSDYLDDLEVKADEMKKL